MPFTARVSVPAAPAVAHSSRSGPGAGGEPEPRAVCWPGHVRADVERAVGGGEEPCRRPGCRRCAAASSTVDVVSRLSRTETALQIAWYEDAEGLAGEGLGAVDVTQAGRRGAGRGAGGGVEREARQRGPAVEVVEVVLVEVVRRGRRRRWAAWPRVWRATVFAQLSPPTAGPLTVTVVAITGRAGDEVGAPERAVGVDVVQLVGDHGEAVGAGPVGAVDAGPAHREAERAQEPVLDGEAPCVEVAVAVDPVEAGDPGRPGPARRRRPRMLLRFSQFGSVVQVVPSGLTWTVPLVRNR